MGTEENQQARHSHTVTPEATRLLLQAAQLGSTRIHLSSHLM
jgi:dolichol kinase